MQPPVPNAGDPPVTRVEIADHVAHLFVTPPVSRDDILGAFGRCGARHEVSRVLERLPDRPFSSLRDLWPELPGVPIEATP